MLSVFVLFHTSVNIFLKAVLNDECVWQIMLLAECSVVNSVVEESRREGTTPGLLFIFIIKPEARLYQF